jgi:hypothetical protein
MNAAYAAADRASFLIGNMPRFLGFVLLDPDHA